MTVLIVPSGIETVDGCGRSGRNRVLIVPSGIETGIRLYGQAYVRCINCT